MKEKKELIRGKQSESIDMFPQTTHVEVITLLSKLDSKKYISVELPMDDMDLTSAESKATYKQIQNYVLEKFGFKVSTLYIAQVKKKHGLEVREHYNISKNEKQKIPQCSIEKEEAILDALKHFKMVYY
ncbi:RNA methyltransferase [Veillonella montpellierensis]|uniref:RNA methyltransferase n=1 Tax=Veillonella montpellierensis TaxID=187328 RepID=UPI0039C66482